MQTSNEIVKNLLIDERIRKIEYDFLTRYFYVIKIPLSNCVYDEISGHSDIFYCSVKDKIICAPNSPIIKNSFILGNSEVKSKYPEDIRYNACQIGENIIGSKYTDNTINPNIIVKQGYTKCSVAITGHNSCITADKEIYEKSIELLEPYNCQILKEATKINLVDKLYSKEMLQETEFYKKFKTSFKILDNIIDYDTSKKDAQHILRNIDNIEVVPKIIYDKNIDLFAEYEKEKEIKKK